MLFPISHTFDHRRYSRPLKALVTHQSAESSVGSPTFDTTRDASIRMRIHSQRQNDAYFKSETSSISHAPGMERFISQVLWRILQVKLVSPSHAHCRTFHTRSNNDRPQLRLNCNRFYGKSFTQAGESL